VYYAQLKGIELTKEYTNNDYRMYYDSDKFEKILSNLLSNALKYTPDVGKVFIRLTRMNTQKALFKYKNLNNQTFCVSKEGYVEISVADTGEGIKNKYIDTIFDRYKRIKHDDKKDYSGSGIGLHFVKRLINIHKGEITLKSTFGKGSEFSFILPLDKDLFSEENFVQTIEGISEHSFPAVEMKFPAEMAVNDVLHSIRNYKIAVIEDNIELCNLLVNTLSGFYHVIHAYDGKKGYELIHTENPDLVISDIMMPEMDGITLCQKIKTDVELNHITVILLSAKSEASDQIDGIRKGADMYIPKPFNLEYLLAVVERQFANSEKLRKNYFDGTPPILAESEINHESLLFLSKINSILEKEITNADLGVETMASKMNMGRSNFYKKFEAITNISPNAYIVKYRINKAVELLITNKYSLAEISDLIGFSNSSYFSTTFKKEKGISPREFLKKTIRRN
jgi:DNA-binding response OmpR family regulator